MIVQPVVEPMEHYTALLTSLLADVTAELGRQSPGPVGRDNTVTGIETQE